MDASTPALNVEDLSVAYKEQQVLDGVCLTLAAGQSLAIVGRSGSGKSTLLSCILGMQKSRAGTISIGGELMQAGRRSAARLRREAIGMIFQAGELLSELTPLENVVIAGLLGGLSDREARARAEELLQELGVPLRDRSTATFSGGEQQRIAVSRALINQPRLLLADEPTASLDDETKQQVCDLLHTLPGRFGCSLVIVTHDQRVAATCNSVARLDRGQLRHEARTPVGQ